VAARYFISALEHLSRHIEETQKRIDRMENDIPVLHKILEGTWNNATKLQNLKSELAALDRKIMTTLAEIN
jgi:predicted  nucleic acid-binding Zn-ribbon protein